MNLQTKVASGLHLEQVWLVTALQMEPSQNMQGSAWGNQQLWGQEALVEVEGAEEWVQPSHCAPVGIPNEALLHVSLLKVSSHP
jgi:hypothetical protein